MCGSSHRPALSGVTDILSSAAEPIALEALDVKLLDNMKISAKAIIPIVLVAVLMVAMVAVSVNGLTTVSSQASLTINHTDPANVLGARTNRLIQSQAYGIY
eukprot:gene4695-6227_t